MRPKVPQYLNLKLCFIGYAFAGKKTQAESLKELYGLQTYQMSDLVDEALQYLLSHPDPIEAQQVERQTYSDTVSEDSEIDEELNAEEDFRQVGVQITDLLKEGKEIPDEVYVRLYVAKLRLTYPHKSKKQLRSEMKAKVEQQRQIRKKIAPLELELEELQNVSEGQKKKKHAKDPQAIQAKIDELNQQIIDLD